MARKRMIDPSFWDDETLGVMSSDHRILFIACLSNADDEGRLKGSPEFLRKMAFGYRDDISVSDVDQWIRELCASVRGLVRYVVDGRTYIEFTNWGKYQTINRPSKSSIPPYIHGAFSESSVSPHAEEKGIEKKRIEEKEKEKGKEGADAPTAAPTCSAADSVDDESPQLKSPLILAYLKSCLEGGKIPKKDQTKTVAAYCDLRGSPNYADDAAIAILELLARESRFKNKPFYYISPAIREHLENGTKPGENRDARKRDGKPKINTKRPVWDY